MLNSFTTLRRVVITGMGCVTPIGIGREAFWSGLHNGVSGISRIDSFDVSNSPVKIAAQVRNFDWQSQLSPKDRKHVPRTVPLALAAAREAFHDAGQTLQESEPRSGREFAPGSEEQNQHRTRGLDPGAQGRTNGLYFTWCSR